MNELLSSIIMAIVQGITEWLPVSSKGHLVLFEHLLNFQQASLMFNVALHFGTLMAVFVYFGSDIVDIVKDFISGNFKSENGRLGILIIIATIPAAIVGYLLENLFEHTYNNLSLTALGFAITGTFLIIASLSHEKANALNSKSAFVIGVAQVFALFPGVSRSGTTIGSGMLLGLKEKQAIKFSFLMSIPIIFGANLITIGNNTLPSNLIWATLVSFVIGLGVIHVLYGRILTNRRNLKWFGLYALVLALIIGGSILVGVKW